MQKVNGVSQVGSESVAQELFFGFAPTASRAQALGFKAQEGAQGAVKVVALGAGDKAMANATRLRN